ncbi:MAG: hypothetical protein CVU05_13150 [Bacteroidetes bacterium HGW-Bacteroidetes-21]|jgi:hypothetical protein|nr:MAG: hypothetical protein CVU05_13150 [Bacteroidetes bacterium HGW-Bacteroidetes-21]
MVIIIVAGTFGGKYADEYFGFSFPVFTVVLSLTSVFLAIYIAVKDFLKMK